MTLHDWWVTVIFTALHSTHRTVLLKVFLCHQHINHLSSQYQCLFENYINIMLILFVTLLFENTNYLMSTSSRLLRIPSRSSWTSSWLLNANMVIFLWKRWIVVILCIMTYYIHVFYNPFGTLRWTILQFFLCFFSRHIMHSLKMTDNSMYNW